MFIDDIRILGVPEKTSAAWRLAMTLLQYAHLQELLEGLEDRRPVSEIHRNDPTNGIYKLLRETVPKSLSAQEHFQKRHEFAHTFLAGLWADAQDYLGNYTLSRKRIMAQIQQRYGVKLNRVVGLVYFPDRDPDPEDGFQDWQRDTFCRPRMEELVQALLKASRTLHVQEYARPIRTVSLEDWRMAWKDDDSFISILRLYDHPVHI